jgi:hypothetical protein
MTVRVRRVGGALAVLVAVGGVASHSAAAASKHKVAVIVVPRFAPAVYADRGAVGLLIPGAGSTVTRAGALSSLVRGRVVSSLLGGEAKGEPVLRLARRPAEITIYIALPPPGRSRNVTRYPIAVVGGGYHGLLRSRSTRIDGLVSVADIAPSVVALRHGRAPRIQSRASQGAPAALVRLDSRLRRAHDSRTVGIAVLVAAVLTLAGLAQLLRSAVLSRAALLAIPAALTVAFVLSAAGIDGRLSVTLLLAIGTVALAFAGARTPRALLPLTLAFLVAAVVALVLWPEVNALSVIGPHPDGGGRYFGVTNEVETLLLGPILAAGALVGTSRLPLVAALALLVVGWSRTGADGGGVLVVVAALAALWSFRMDVRWTPARLAAAAAATVGLGALVVGVDVLSGGSSHVTSSLGKGPWSVVGEIGHRLHISWAGATATTQAIVTLTLMLVAWGVLALPRERSDVVDALLSALVVSLLVNDSPVDVIAYGALVGAALRTWDDLDLSTRGRRSFSALSPQVLPMLHRR